MIKKRLPKPILYILCAGIATLIDIGLLFIFTEFFKIMYLFSATLSYTSGIAVNYGLNRKITFKNKSRKIFKQFMLFVFVSLVGLIFTLLFIALFVEILNIWYIFAKLMTIALVFIWSYNANNKLTFKIFN
ncbi:GtrA family protein [Candidatus Woesearchaeota archaeon]|jgi:putative flippase GtrA|nr:GtrA family protein [Candidatus Woesearchaeota archaeon]MBT6735117.1 GtrA family protein [Candidatus Woesearchaeota archaeon]